MKKHLHIVLIILIALFTGACNQPGINVRAGDPAAVSPFAIHPDSITVEGDYDGFSLSRRVSGDTGHVQLITYTFTAAEPAVPGPVRLKFSFPSVDIYGYWNPSMSVDKVNYYYSGITSKSSRYAPVLAYYNSALRNRICISVSDALNQVRIGSYLKEEDVFFHPEITLFDERMPASTKFEVSLRIDTRDIPFYKAVDEVASWWVAEGYTPMQVPETAKMPMYSTWYSYHQQLDPVKIVEECKIARSLGCRAVIVDDGWQTKDNNRGYAYTGDWEPERIPDMRSFVRAVHDADMQFILWYSLPFMGEKAANFDRFKGKYLRFWESQGTWVLDPRYPEVREYITTTFTRALEDWDLDGFKIDFIGFFTANDDTELTKKNGRDFASVNEATNVLMTDISKKLSALKPDILIEFRQPYIGPVMRQYGNMFRGVDAPNNAVANRLETTNLRIMAQNTAVHSDMFIWRPEEPVEHAALQILNILYSVPQLSVRLKEIPDDHLDMIRFWFDYWLENRDILLDGIFTPSNPGANYPVLMAEKNGKRITTVYENIIVDVNRELKHIDVINAKAGKQLALKFNNNFSGRMVIKDCLGRIVYDEKVKFSEGMKSIEVPPSGMASLSR